MGPHTAGCSRSYSSRTTCPSTQLRIYCNINTSNCSSAMLGYRSHLHVAMCFTLHFFDCSSQASCKNNECDQRNISHCTPGSLFLSLHTSQHGRLAYGLRITNSACAKKTYNHHIYITLQQLTQWSELTKWLSVKKIW
jgi:hypothetical protein